MSLAICTPTRCRWHWLARQAVAIAPQLNPDDRWVIGIDNDVPDERYTDRIRELIGERLLVWAHFCYERPEPPVGLVNRLRNSLVAFAPPQADIVEIDDHDLLRPDALAEVRHALHAGNDYIFSWHAQDVVIEDPNGGLVLEKWPDERPRYTSGAFARGEVQASGLRAIRRSLWNRLNGWSSAVWPEGNMDMAIRAEAAGAAICCVEKPLCTVLVDPADGISTRYRRTWAPEGSQAPSK